LILQSILVQNELVGLGAGECFDHEFRDIPVDHQPFLELLDVAGVLAARAKPARAHGRILARRHQAIFFNQLANVFD
jgi:hypothetical protein